MSFICHFGLPSFPLSYRINLRDYFKYRSCYCFVWLIVRPFQNYSAPRHVILVKLSIKVPVSTAPVVGIWLRIQEYSTPLDTETVPRYARGPTVVSQNPFAETDRDSGSLKCYQSL